MDQAFVIWGGYGGHNLGDEAILWALSRQLRRQEPKTRQIVLIPGSVSDATRSQYAEWGIEVHSGPRPFVYSILFRARLVVGGGQMVDDSTPGWPVGWTSLLILINRLLWGTSIIVCIGAEPLRRRLARTLVSRIYSLAQGITCRDDASAAVLIDAGVPKDKVHVTRDVVFSLDPAVVPRWQSGRHGAAIKIALLMAYDPTRIREKTDRSQSLIEALLRRNIAVTLVAHDLREGYDRVAVEEIASRFAGHPLLGIFNGNRVEDVLALYSDCDAVISGRMHPLILASLTGTLPIAFGGKAKVQSLLKISSIPTLADAPPEQQVEQIFELIARRDQIQGELQQQIRAFRADVELSIAQALALTSRDTAIEDDSLGISREKTF
jgi:polysaccharide pyruvyl transferase WcaK-like protein